MSQVNEHKYGRVRIRVIGNLAEFPEDPSPTNLTIQLILTKNHYRHEEVVDEFTLGLIDGEREVELSDATEEERIFEIPWHHGYDGYVYI